MLQADAYVFSRQAFVWDELDPRRRAIIAPSIDVVSPKYQELAPDAVDGILSAAGLRSTDGGRDLCTELIRPGGHVANVGVHGHPVTLHLETLWIRDVTLTTGLVDAVTTPMLLRLIESGRLDRSRFVTHRLDPRHREGRRGLRARGHDPGP